MNQRMRMEAELARLLQPVARRWRLAVDDRMAAYGLSDATGWVLLHVGRLGDGVRQSELCAAVDISSGSLVRLVDQLEAANLVERRADGSDRRANGLYLTDAGRDLTGRIEKDLRAIRTAMCDGIDDADMETVLRVLGLLDARILAIRDARP